MIYLRRSESREFKLSREIIGLIACGEFMASQSNVDFEPLSEDGLDESISGKVPGVQVVFSTGAGELKIQTPKKFVARKEVVVELKSATQGSKFIRFGVSESVRIARSAEKALEQGLCAMQQWPKKVNFKATEYKITDSGEQYLPQYPAQFAGHVMIAKSQALALRKAQDGLMLEALLQEKTVAQVEVYKQDGMPLNNKQGTLKTMGQPYLTFDWGGKQMAGLLDVKEIFEALDANAMDQNLENSTPQEYKADCAI